MQLSQLLEGISLIHIQGNTEYEVSRICFDSREVVQGSVFVCLTGGKLDGHDFVEEAESLGAVAVVCTRVVSTNLTFILVEDTRQTLCEMAANYYGRPANKLDIVTVTGTNGKTSFTYLLSSILEQARIPVGLIGTMGSMIKGKAIRSYLTTPDPVELQSLLSRMVSEGVKVCVMEASAHAIFHQKLYGLHAKLGVFTNISRDHLDFFGNMQTYAAVKRSYFTPENCKFALINADDIEGEKIIRESDCEMLSYGIDKPSDVFALNIVQKVGGNRFILNVFDEVSEISSHLYGKFNVYNMLAAAGAAAILGVDNEKIVAGLESIRKVEGRFNVLESRQGFKIVIDYAHTPDGLENVLEAARELGTGRLILVFGCGGDRDKGKRPLMGKIAGEGADLIIVTSDNPRYEDPFTIMKDIEGGARGKCLLIENRTKAIHCALHMASGGDVVLICGKGGECAQEIAGIKYPYSDEKVVRGLL